VRPHREGCVVKVLLSGYYGFANTGDEAICLAITRELKRLGHEVTVLSSDPAKTAAQYGVRAIKRMNPLDLIPALLGTDALLSGGGGLLQDKTSSRTLTYYLALIRLARLFGKRVAIFNQSIGPLTQNGETRVAAALKNTINIVRDTGSKALLERLGLGVQLGGDPALLLEAPSGVTRDENAVVIAPREGQTEATQNLVTVAQNLVKEGKRIIVLGFQPGWDDMELGAFKTVSGATLESTADPARALEIIASSGAVIGVRLHAVILGAATRTPFYGISYDPKVQGFCRDAGALEVSVNFDSAVLTAAVLERREPHWNAVDAMRDRARESFGWALGKS
jgi:polysaccharide pyruvyl transferase CsaB